MVTRAAVGDKGWMVSTFLCGWGDRTSITETGGCQWIQRESLWLFYCYAETQ